MRLKIHRGHLNVVASCMVNGRFTKEYLEARKGTYRDSDEIIKKIINAKAPFAERQVPFLTSLEISASDFYQSRAAKNMAELGFTPDQETAALLPFKIID